MENSDNVENSERRITKTCCVLGGRGFIGRALVDMLLREEKKNWIVRIADRYRELPSTESALLSDAIASGRASYFNLDRRLPYKSQVIQAFQGASVVFYIDDVDLWPTDFYTCYQIIVQGAKDVVSACRQCKVKQLIYNSSADVVFDDVHHIHDGDESLPYSGRYWDMVSDLRAQAEALILAANDINGLLTCALRPCNVFGPGDKLVPMLVNVVKSNWTKFIIGSGNNTSDFTYVDNVAHAHICAEESLSSSLSSQMVSASGKVFFITNMDPMVFWEFASLLLWGLGYQRPVISLPVWIVSYIVSLMKSLNLKSDLKNLDPCTSAQNVAALALRTRTFDCCKAQRYIQYSPIVSLEEAMASTVDSFSHLATDSHLGGYDFDKPSNMEKLFGGGKVADMLLWRDEKRTFFCCLFLALLYHWFFLSGRTIIASVGKLLLLTIVLLSGNHILPLTVCGYKISRLSSSCFEISEVDMRIPFFAITFVWNKLCFIVNSLAEGEDWSIFIKAAAFLYFCKLIIPNNFATTIGLVLVLSFTLGFIYEQYEKSFEGISTIAINIAHKALSTLSRNVPIVQTLLSKETGSSVPKRERPYRPMH